MSLVQETTTAVIHSDILPVFKIEATIEELTTGWVDVLNFARGSDCCYSHARNMMEQSRTAFDPDSPQSLIDADKNRIMQGTLIS